MIFTEKKFSDRAKSSCAKNGEAKTGINPICLHSNSQIRYKNSKFEIVPKYLAVEKSNLESS